MRAMKHFLLAVSVLAALAAGPVSAQDLVPWARDLRQAMDIAAAQNRLVLIHFWSDDCAPCRSVEQKVFTRPEVAQAMSANYVPVKVNAKSSPEVARQFGVDRWPTDVIVNSRGEEIYRRVSLQDPVQYAALIDQVAAKSLPAAGQPWEHVAQAPQRGASPYQPVQYEGPASPYQQPQYGREASPYQSGPYDAARSQYPPQQQQSPAAGGNSQNYGPNYGANYAPNNSQSGQPSSQGYDQNNSQGYGQGGGQGYSPYVAAPANNSPQPRSPEMVVNREYSGAGATPDRQSWQNDPRYQQNDPRSQQPGGAYQQQQGNGAYQQDQSGYGDQPYGRNPNLPPPPSYDTPRDAQFGGNAVNNPYQGQPAWAGDSRTQQAAPPQTHGYQPAGIEPPRQTPQIPAGNPPLAMDGYCPVTLVEKQKWIQADAQWGAIHRGRTYLFAGQAEQQRFLANPDAFSPVISGFDPVKLRDQGQWADGKRQHGVFYHHRIYLFSDEPALQRFWQSPDYYAAAAQQAMQQNAVPNVQR
jgi:thioredoxin-related protein/YHS domain-containing protein